MKQSSKKNVILSICACIIAGCGNGASPSNTSSSANIQTNIKPVPANRYAYVTSFKDSGITVCQLNKDKSGGLSNCSTMILGILGHPQGLAIAPSYKKLYISTSNSVIYRCDINNESGGLSNCYAYGSSVINSPTFMTVDPAGKNLYLSDEGKNSVVVCKINTDESESLSNCVTAGEGFVAPRGISISPNGKFFYIANRSVPAISICTLKDGDRVFNKPCSSYERASMFTELSGVAVDKSGDYVYISDLGSDVFARTCFVNGGGQGFSSCNGLKIASVNGADGAALDSSGTYIYMTLPNNNLVYSCKMIAGTYNNCKTFAGNGEFYVPNAIAVF